MDTITHGIAGALIGKAIFRGEDMLASRAMNRARVITWALMLGAIFPDSDTFRDLLSRNELLVITWHRSITHSFVCLPFFAAALAALTRWFARWRKWEAPSFAALTGIYAIGILSHILLDLVTSFGTMIWSPLNWSRPAWDLLFIIDFTFTTILLVPQFVAWAYANPGRVILRTLGTWFFFALGPLLVASMARRAGVPISGTVIVASEVILAALFFLPLVGGWGLRLPPSVWNRAGLTAGCVYLGLTFAAHEAALGRIKEFAASKLLEPESLGALPLPPSLWHWDGLIRTSHGVYEMRMNLAEKASMTEVTEASSLEYRFYPDAPPNSYIELAKRLPEVQKVLWFSRFPVTQFHKESGYAVVEISDARFASLQRERAGAFTYRVRFGPDGNVLSQGWARR